METELNTDQAPKPFSWVPIYHGIAVRLLDFESRQGELIDFLEQLRKQGFAITPLTDQDAEGGRFLLTEIDPFTFFGVFNRGLTRDNRRAILQRVRDFLHVTDPLPDDFDGVPVINNQQSWFFSYLPSRRPDDVPRLWRVFRLAFGDSPLGTQEFAEAFDDALTVRGTNLNLTMGLFWARPDVFIGLDGPNRQLLEIKLPPTGLSAHFYFETVRNAAGRGKPFTELSREAWLQGAQPKPKPPAAPAIPGTDINYWLVGAHWSDQDPPDMTERFTDEGIWQNGYQDGHYDEEVRAMAVGERIAIKALFTQRNSLPFDNREKTISAMRIRAIGTIVANRGDGRTVEVEWDPSFQSKPWYFHTYRGTVWRVRPDNELSRRLIDFTFSNAPQDYEWFMQRLIGDGLTPPGTLGVDHPYDLADLVASGVFAPEHELRQAYDRLVSKKNLIIQGAPGVGKTFIVRKLAYAFLGAQDDSRIQMIQFHQSYSYDDFMRGYRPDGSGGFRLQDGVFLRFCEKARSDADQQHVFIIDEINRGNLSQIFGEVLMLIESDKRGPQHSVPLVYRQSESETFYVPENVYVVGLMNVADRSLAIVDYALRRRFSFMTLRPAFSNLRFKQWLLDRNMAGGIIELIVERMTSLNAQIAEDPTLGENYQVGHSYFCPKGEDFHGLDRRWYEGIIETELVPLLREYWFDNPARAEEARMELLAP